MGYALHRIGRGVGAFTARGGGATYQQYAAPHSAQYEHQSSLVAGSAGIKELVCLESCRESCHTPCTAVLVPLLSPEGA